MELSVAERIVLLSVLPAEGDLTTMRLTKDLRRELGFTEDEHDVLKFRTEDGLTKWDSEADVEKEIAIGPRAHVMVADALKELDESKKLNEDHLTLCEKFLDESS